MTHSWTEQIKKFQSVQINHRLQKLLNGCVSTLFTSGAEVLLLSCFAFPHFYDYFAFCKIGVLMGDLRSC